MNVLVCRFFSGSDDCYYQLSRYDVDVEEDSYIEHYIGIYDEYPGLKFISWFGFEVDEKLKKKYNLIICADCTEGCPTDYYIPWGKENIDNITIKKIRYKLGMIPEKYCHSGMTVEEYLK